MLLASESIRLWLKTQLRPGNQDLLERVIEAGTDLELQVNVSPLGGEPVEGKPSSYTNGIDEWFSFRVPKGAATNSPHWKDYLLRYNLAERVDAIGCTGWNWKRKVSQWVGFDFDSIVGHAAGVGISNAQLDEIRTAVQALPYVEVRKSTGGLGLHLYVHLDDIPCENHTEHAAIARCVLAKMSEQVNMDLLQHVDACGGNMWIASRRATAENNGLGLMKRATCKFTELPENWRDHAAVVTRSRPRVSVSGVDATEEDIFTQLTSSHRRVPLDDSHLAVRARLADLGCAVWVQDHYLLQTHTRLLKRVHEEMELKGVFETSSPGSNTREPNCFGFPVDGGAWKFFRFGQGTAEHASWKQDGRTWTTCYFNREATLDAAAAVAGGKLLTNGGYEFSTLKQASDMLNKLSPHGKMELNVDPRIAQRKAVVKRNKDGNVTVEVAKTNEDGELDQWNSTSKKGHWSQTIPMQSDPAERRILDYDGQVRCLSTVNGDPAGWAVLEVSGKWLSKNATSVRKVFLNTGLDGIEADRMMGAAETNTWRLVSLPFTDEYPGDRQWNRRAPQLVYAPKEPEEGANAHPHWDMILNHCGMSLDSSLAMEAWARDAGVVTGQQYLQCWMASVIREPFQPLPYLFFFGGENCGKSIFHEAFALLVTKGVVKADKSLTNTNEFNGELEGCIVAVVEEKNIAANATAHNRIKDAVTSPKLSIRRMQTDTYEVPNSTHWVQCANNPDYCPIFPGDTRITMLYVEKLQKEIPKAVLTDHLKEEAPYFLWSLLHTTLPQKRGRLRIPVVNTKFKEDAAAMNKSHVELFIEDHCLYSPQGSIPFADFHKKFQSWLAASSGETCSKNKLGRSISTNERLKTTKLADGKGSAVAVIQGIVWSGETK